MTQLPAIAREVLDYWFGGAAGGDPDALKAAFERWFKGGVRVDEEIREQFSSATETALDGGFESWEDDPRACLALIILLDQFPRNVYRRTARAFAGDIRALRLAQEMVEGGGDSALTLIERVFLLMPFQHSEDIDMQRRSVELFAALTREPAPPGVGPLLQSSLEYAHKHHDIIERFGRFPYRNEALGRDNTPAEIEWLDSANERFGQ